MGQEACSRLVLGTAQLGMNYGVANTVGQPDRSAALRLVEAAWQGGVREFDTAQNYGNAESVLGWCFAQLRINGEAQVITKLAPELDLSNEVRLGRAVERSLKRLGQQQLYGLLLHREEALEQWEQGLGKQLYGLVKAGLVEHLGVSVYTPQAALKALDLEGLSLLQLPGNIFDRRFEEAGVFAHAAKKGVMIYVRSIFLQGLALMHPDQVSSKMAGTVKYVNRAAKLAEELGVTRTVLALTYARQGLAGSRVLFGAETVDQVCQNLQAWKADIPVNLVCRVRQLFTDVDEHMLNPTLWAR